MRNRDLIKLLKKQDPDAIVILSDADHGHNEWAGFLKTVYEFDHEGVEDDAFRLDETLKYTVLKS